MGQCPSLGLSESWSESVGRKSGFPGYAAYAAPNSTGQRAITVATVACRGVSWRESRVTTRDKLLPVPNTALAHVFTPLSGGGYASQRETIIAVRDFVT